jgi:phage-related tail protein
VLAEYESGSVQETDILPNESTLSATMLVGVVGIFVAVGALLGALLGDSVGASVGVTVGDLVGDLVGDFVGFVVGAFVGTSVPLHIVSSAFKARNT